MYRIILQLFARGALLSITRHIIDCAGKIKKYRQKRDIFSHYWVFRKYLGIMEAIVAFGLTAKRTRTRNMTTLKSGILQLGKGSSYISHSNSRHVIIVKWGVTILSSFKKSLVGTRSDKKT